MKKQASYITKELLLLSIFSLSGTVSFEQEMKEMFAKKEILADTSLTNNCYQWKVTSSGKRKVDFGPFKIIAADYGKTKKLSKKKTGNIFNADYVTEKTRTSSLTVLCNEKDTAVINMLVLLTDVSESHNGLFAKGDPEESHSAKLNEMSISIGADTSVWHFIPSLISPKIGTATIDYFGKIVNGKDTISIIYAKGFKDIEKTWSGYPTGLLFIKDSRQIAALQYKKGYSVWLTTSGEENLKTMLGSFMAAYISAVQN